MEQTQPEPQNAAHQPEELPPVPSAGELETQLAKCEALRDEYLAGWQRAKADFLNHKNAEYERLTEATRYANEELMRELMITLDNFDLAIASMERTGAVDKGIHMIRAQLGDALKRRGLSAIEAAIGEQFDPRTQEAIVIMDSDKPGGTVLEQIESGYRLHDKIIRPVRVKIAKEKS